MDELPPYGLAQVLGWEDLRWVRLRGGFGWGRYGYAVCGCWAVETALITAVEAKYARYDKVTLRRDEFVIDGARLALYLGRCGKCGAVYWCE
jgi:hypothetical protein